MKENEEPDWLAELAKSAEALRSQIEQGGETLRRQAGQLGRAAEQFVRDVRQTTPTVGPVPPFQQWVVRAVDALMRELLTPRSPVVHQISLHGTITMSGSLAMPPMGLAGEVDAAAAMDSVAVEVAGSRRGLSTWSDGEIVFLVLVWIYAVWLPWVGSRLPPELHGMLTDSYATVAIALAITWRIRDRHR